MFTRLSSASRTDAFQNTTNDTGIRGIRPRWKQNQEFFSSWGDKHAAEELPYRIAPGAGGVQGRQYYDFPHDHDLKDW